MAAVGLAWGLYDSLKTSAAGAAPAASAPPGAPAAAPAGAPPLPAASSAAHADPAVPPDVVRVVRLAASAAGADGEIADGERALILRHAREAGVESLVDDALRTRRPLAEIVAGVAGVAERRDLYVLAYSIVRADETVSGAERIYLAQLAHALGLDAPTVAALEQQTAAAIDGEAGIEPQAP